MIRSIIHLIIQLNLIMKLVSPAIVSVDNMPLFNFYDIGGIYFPSIVGICVLIGCRTLVVICWWLQFVEIIPQRDA